MATNNYWVRLNATTTGLDINNLQSLIDKKAKSLTSNPELRRQVGETYLKIVTPYIPKNTGNLRASGRATTDGRVYWDATDSKSGYNYTQWAYTHEASNPTTFGTHAYWNTYVEQDDFITAITPLIRDAFSKE